MPFLSARRELVEEIEDGRAFIIVHRPGLGMMLSLRQTGTPQTVDVEAFGTA